MGVKRKPFYGVKRGHGGPRVLESWAECQLQITGFKGARFRRFDTREEAELYIRGENPISPTDEGYSLETMAEAEHLSHVLCFAGVCQTDPGPSAAAAAIYHRAANIGHPRPVWRDVKFLPHSTATEADYKGLLVG
ncbi:unnamed protein product [Discosporangium mesarthrocarpum]